MAGLSPRVRGNQCGGLRMNQRNGSIPARAGEPGSPSSSDDVPRVYPRACGGTVFTNDWHKEQAGLSPRVRGNRR